MQNPDRKGSLDLATNAISKVIYISSSAHVSKHRDACKCQYETAVLVLVRVKPLRFSTLLNLRFLGLRA